MTNLQKRLELQKKLEKVPNVAAAYFQAPSTVKMVYPCIRYARTDIEPLYADDSTYIHKWQYTLTIIDPDPDTNIPDYIISNFPYCSLNGRPYTVDNLNHYILTLYY